MRHCRRQGQHQSLWRFCTDFLLQRHRHIAKHNSIAGVGPHSFTFLTIASENPQWLHVTLTTFSLIVVITLYLFPPLSVRDNPCYFQHDTLTDLFEMWTKSCDSSTWDPHTWNKILVLPYGPEILFLNVYPKELKSRCGRDYAFCSHCNIIPRSRDMRCHNMSLSARTDKSYLYVCGTYIRCLLFTLKRKGKPTVYDNMDETWGCYI